jgi:hypothetical protein
MGRIGRSGLREDEGGRARDEKQEMERRQDKKEGRRWGNGRKARLGDGGPERRGGEESTDEHDVFGSKGRAELGHAPPPRTKY